jgi:charged multivesicular body protein 2A
MSFIEAIFGKKKTPKELMREYKRSIDRSVRELEREKRNMEMQEKKLIADMKKMAKQNQMDAVKIMARDLVRTRRYQTKFVNMRAQLVALGLRLQTLQSTQEMTNAMRGMTRVMNSMNSQMKLPQMQKIMTEFAKQNEMMDMKEEMMSDMIDDVMSGENDEEEEEGLVSQVLDEIGLSMGERMGETPASHLQTSATKQADDDLQARLENLRNN